MHQVAAPSTYVNFYQCDADGITLDWFFYNLKKQPTYYTIVY